MLEVVDVRLLLAIDAVFNAQTARKLALPFTGGNELAIEHLVRSRFNPCEVLLERFFVQIVVVDVVEPQVAQSAVLGERPHGNGKALVGVERRNIVDDAVECPIHIPDAQLVKDTFAFQESLERAERLDEIDGVRVLFRHDVLARAFTVEDERFGDARDALRADDRGR